MERMALSAPAILKTTEMKYLLAFALLILSLQHSFSQNSFGLEFGTEYYIKRGINDFDSIRVDLNKDELGEVFVGLFYETDIQKRISLHGKFLYRRTGAPYMVYNFKEDCMFCPVRKGDYSSVTNFSLELMPRLKVIKYNDIFSFWIFGGVNTNINFQSSKDKIFFGKGRHGGVAKVINSLDNEIKPLTFNWLYGFSVEFFERVALWSTWQAPSEFTRPVTIDGKKYPFRNTWSYLQYSITYRFYSLKRKKNKS